MGDDRDPRIAAPLDMRNDAIEAALDAWYGRGDWRALETDIGRPRKVREGMSRAIAAADTARGCAVTIDPTNEAQQKCIALEIIRAEHPSLDPEKYWRSAQPAAIRALTALGAFALAEDGL